MFAYIVRRLFLMLVTLFGISVIIFVLLRVVPGNIVDILFDAAGFVDGDDDVLIDEGGIFVGVHAVGPRCQDMPWRRTQERLARHACEGVLETFVVGCVSDRQHLAREDAAHIGKFHVRLRSPRFGRAARVILRGSKSGRYGLWHR